MNKLNNNNPDGRMHIAHFTNTYHPVTSGVVRSVSTFRKALTRLGHNVFIFAQHSENYEDKEPFVFRYPALELPMVGDFPLTIPVYPFVDTLIPILKLNVIHSHHPFLLGQAAVRKAKKHNLPLVFTFHTRYQEYSHYVSLNQEFVKKAIGGWLGDYMGKCHHIVVPTKGIKEILQKQYGISDQITAIPTGIDLEPYQAADGQSIRQEYGWQDDFVLISAGRLAPEKNWKTLLRAVAEAGQQHPNIRLVLLGEGEQREDLEELARSLDIHDRVELVGRVPFESVPEYFSAADLFCFASVTETQGLVTMEAIAAGLPVVAVNATGTCEVIEHQQQGLLTDNDSQALAQAISSVIADDDLRHKFKAAAVERAKFFDARTQAKRLLRVYERANEDQKGGRYVQVTNPEYKIELSHKEFWYQFLGI